jgi:SHS2 domain-containing protein
LTHREESRSEGYRFLEHMTDAEIEAYGSDLDVAFENAAIALEDTMVDIKTISPLINENIKVDGDDKEELLYNWLEALIIRQDTASMLYSKFECKISKVQKTRFILDAQVSGEKFNPKKHEQKTAIKAPTYHEMVIKENLLTKNNPRRRVTLRFLLDL